MNCFEEIGSDELTNPEPPDREIVLAKMMQEAPKFIVNGRDMRAQVLIASNYVNPTSFEMKNVLIAYKFCDERVVCPKCALSHDLVEMAAIPIYPVNIVPYSQSCHDCGRRIVIGWNCELYDKPASLSRAIESDAIIRATCKKATRSFLREMVKMYRELLEREAPHNRPKTQHLIDLFVEELKHRNKQWICKCGQECEPRYDMVHNSYSITCPLCGHYASALNEVALKEQWYLYNSAETFSLCRCGKPPKTWREGNLFYAGCEDCCLGVMNTEESDLPELWNTLISK